jgi:type IV secretion system protein VirB10
MRNSLIVLEERERSDPRLEIEPQALALANRNSFPVVAQRSARKEGTGLAIGVAGALVLGGITFLTLSGHRAVEHQKPAATMTLPSAHPSGLAVPPQAITQVPGAGTSTAQAPNALPAPAVQASGSRVLPQTMSDMRSAPTLVVDRAAGEANSSPLAVSGRSSSDDALGLRVGGPEVAAATRMEHPGQTVAQGTLIPAVLETAINSDLPGYVRAVVSSDIKSFDGNRVLVPRSSRLIGQYKSGVSGGQTRAYVMWTRLIRPDGVSVQLASPAVDESGQTGLTGSVDNHFMKRFGSALLLSVVGTASAVASGGASLIVGGGESAAAVAAQRDSQIAPTIRVRQGQPIRVFTAKDLDFSTVSGADL